MSEQTIEIRPNLVGPRVRPTCSTCDYFLKNQTKKNELIKEMSDEDFNVALLGLPGECRRKSPIVVQENNAFGYWYGKSQWPVTMPKDFCGDWKNDAMTPAGRK